MNFLLDHDVPAEVARVLLSDQHEVLKVIDILPVDSSDEKVFGEAIRRCCVLITCNRDDFLRLARSRRHRGLVILIRRRTRIAECASVLRLIRNAGEDGILCNVNFA